MRVLITGGAGFIGSRLFEAMLDQGHHVLIMDNLSTGSIDNIAHLKGRDGFEYFIDRTISNVPPLEPGARGCLARRRQEDDRPQDRGGLSAVRDRQRARSPRGFTEACRGRTGRVIELGQVLGQVASASG